MSKRRDQQSDDYDDGRGPEPDPKRPSPAAHPLRPVLVFGALFGVVVGFGGLAILAHKSNQSSQRMRKQSANNLKQIALAIQNSLENNGELPSNCCGPDGKPLLSWRVLILPYIEQRLLFKQFKLDEPWDGPNNIALLNQMPPIYSGTGAYGQSMTHYRGFSNPGGVFDRLLRLDQPLPEKDQLRPDRFADLPSETLLVVEAGVPVEWTKPDDLDASPGKPFPKMGGLGWRKVFQAAMADGSVRSLRLDLPEPTLRALVTHSGGEPLPPGWDAQP